MQKRKIFLYLLISGIVLILWTNNKFSNEIHQQWNKYHISLRCFKNITGQNEQDTNCSNNPVNISDKSTTMNDDGTSNGTNWSNNSDESRKSTSQNNNSTIHLSNATKPNDNSTNQSNDGTNQKNHSEIDFSRDISSRHFFTEKMSPTMVPNIVHYIWFGKRNFEFLNALSVYSAYKFINPSEIIFHGDNVPLGKWWKFVIKNTKNVRFVHAKRPLRIYGKTLAYFEHSADILRLKILQDNGGIYLDTDVLVLKSFDTLRKYDVTMGQETEQTLANGIILAKKGAPFLRLIFEAYHSYTRNEWGKHSVVIPNQLAKIYPHLIHVEQKSLIKPNFLHAKLLFRGHYNWTENYAIHVWWRDPSAQGGYLPKSPMETAHLDTTLGEIMRKIIFGKPDLIGQKKQTPAG